MSQLGTRLLFFEVPSVPPVEADLLAFAKNKMPDLSEIACNNIVNEFLVEFFERFPVGSVQRGLISITDALLSGLVRRATLLVNARAEIICEKQEGGTNYLPVAAMQPESVYKVINYFMDFALGHALVSGRMCLTAEDLDLVEEVAISSIPRHLRQIIKHLRSQSNLDTPTAQSLCSVSPPTARSYMKQAVMLGLADTIDGCLRTDEPHRISLAPAYKWLKLNLEI